MYASIKDINLYKNHAGATQKVNEEQSEPALCQGQLSLLQKLTAYLSEMRGKQ